MNIGFLYIALVIAGIALAILLGWFLIEAIMSVRQGRARMNKLLTKYARLIENDHVNFTYVRGDLNLDDSRANWRKTQGRHYGSRWQ